MNRYTRQANEKKKNKSSPRYQIDTFDEWDAPVKGLPLWFFVLNSLLRKDEMRVLGTRQRAASVPSLSQNQ